MFDYKLVAYAVSTLYVMEAIVIFLLIKAGWRFSDLQNLYTKISKSAWRAIANRAAAVARFVKSTLFISV